MPRVHPDTDPTAARTRGLLLAAAAIVLALGGWARLAPLRESLWLDEFGTLWVVERGLADLWARSLEFQAHSPAYYALPWASLQLLGESELALRLPSVLLGLATCAALFWVGREVGGVGVGAVAALLGWIAPPLVSGSVEARHYALSALATALLLLGFLRAARTGAARDRALCGAGALLLLYGHYLQAWAVAGLAVAWLALPALRAVWTPRRALFDAALVGALSVPGLLHVTALLGRPAPSHLGEPQWLIPAALLSVYAVAALPGLLLRWRELDAAERARVVALAFTCAVPCAALLVLALAGRNMLSFRYLSNLAVPACALGALGLVRYAERGRPPAVAAVAAAVLVSCAGFEVGRPHPDVGSSRWRALMPAVRRAVAAEPGPVLMRSAFIEDDLRPLGVAVPPVTLAPLRSPGEAAPAWDVVPLTARWLPGPFYDEQVAARIGDARVFYFVGFAGYIVRGDENFVNGLVAWARARYGADVKPELVAAEPPGQKSPVLIALRFRRP